MTKRAPASMCLTRSSRSCKDACTLEHNVDTHPPQGSLRRFTFAQNRIVDAINIQTAVPGVDIPGPSSINGVEFQKVSEIVSRQHVVYRGETKSGIISTIFKVDLPIRPKPLIAMFSIWLSLTIHPAIARPLRLNLCDHTPSVVERRLQSHVTMAGWPKNESN